MMAGGAGRGLEVGLVGVAREGMGGQRMREGHPRSPVWVGPVAGETMAAQRRGWREGREGGD
jgi:hypothetical protein